MSSKASVSRQWVVRMLITGVVFTGFGLWAVYDGSVAYPRRNQAIEAYREYREQGRDDEWRQLAEQEGWPAEPDEDDYKSEWDIRTQFIMAALCLPFGLLVLLRLGLKSRQSMSTDEQAFRTCSGTVVPYADIVRIDWRRWPGKGIADVYYRNGRGGEKRARVDAWIFKDGEAVIADIEQATGLSRPATATPEGEADDELAESANPRESKSEETQADSRE